ncbi:hypothetical protein BC351_00715 [Paenibacillus ferrarius]|uniref:Uncharacterized protein n=1 Tax=Paenibacillus ferrarius TaxID=1469647 RepID=A0A1V4HT94_9BACL|nr:hypothetical protein [Paenibacillus ferrarius]OPH61795.1 hypothetical protein BC351_00715 [Paenibacillus ferrarius]
MRIAYLHKTKNTPEELILINQDDREISPDHTLASINDLNDYSSVGVSFNDLIIKVKEGFCKWYYYEFTDSCGEEDFNCGYELINTYSISEPA